MPERLQKLLAKHGIASRRQVETWITEKRITVNGEIAKLGCQAEATDTITLNDEALVLAPTKKHQHLMYNKPCGEICTREDPQGRPTVFDNLPPLENSRWINIGRLDVNTEGLLLFTTDGDLANQFMHPKNEVPRTYLVKTTDEITAERKKQLSKGVKLEDGMARFDDIKLLENQQAIVTLHRGKNREVRRLFESQGLKVMRLKRIAFAGVTLPKGMPRGDLMILQTLSLG
ncbi:MAG: hypothetical protein DHS20C10_05510 [marine bacterium B5-7]|nr:MAG: hypothetical protein DHS20C10_05510 [marine bacterium B5-7]